jgi:hypothetical protein
MPAFQFVPDDFAVPTELVTAEFRLVPLGPEHNERDYAAWTSSIDHIRATPGFGDGLWPPPEGMTLEQNHADLEGHARDFAERNGFTYTVLDLAGKDVIGCVYIYPAREAGYDARLRSWVRASVAQLDAPLHRAALTWLAEHWPFQHIEYAPRSGG